MEANDRINKTSKEKQQRQFKENVISATDGLKKIPIRIYASVYSSQFLHTYKHTWVLVRWYKQVGRKGKAREQQKQIEKETVKLQINTLTLTYECVIIYNTIIYIHTYIKYIYLLTYLPHLFFKPAAAVTKLLLHFYWYLYCVVCVNYSFNTFWTL